MDWREVGNAVRDRWRQCLSEHARIRAQRGVQQPGEIYLIDLPLVWLADGFADGYDASRFSNQEYRRWLSSSGALTFAHQEPNGRPRGDALRAAATLARYFYDAWRLENRKRGVQDYGVRGEMKDDSAKFIVEDFFAWRFSERVCPVFLWELGKAKDAESLNLMVRDLMDKPRARRDPGSEGHIEFLGSDEGMVLNLPPKLA